MGKNNFVHWFLGLIDWEDVFWLIDISAELEVVDLSDVSLVQVFSNQKLEETLSFRNDLQFFQSSSELLHSDVARLGSIVILERWLDENSLVSNFSSNG